MPLAFFNQKTYNTRMVYQLDKNTYVSGDGEPLEPDVEFIRGTMGTLVHVCSSHELMEDLVVYNVGQVKFDGISRNSYYCTSCNKTLIDEDVLSDGMGTGSEGNG